MSDRYDWEKDDLEILRRLGLPEQWIEEERECECGWVGLVQILIPNDSPHLWCWDCPECAYEHEEPAQVLPPL